MEPPAFPAAALHTVRAAPGSAAALVLPTPSGTPPFQYQWSRAGATLDERFTTSDEAGAVRLTVSAARTTDTGVYTLQASNVSGSDTARVRLEVAADEAPTGEDPPTFLRRLQDLTVKVGTRTRFLVEIVSSTECKVTWYRNERRLLEAERVSLARDGHFWCADVSAVSVDDAGRWTCTAENAGGRASCSAHLNVLVPKAYKRPEFVEELRALLTEQGTVSLECKVVGVPTPVLRWFKDSREIKAGDVFALTANAEDPTSLGTYTCEAVNCMGRAYSSSKVHVVGRASREGSAKPSSSITEPPPIFTKELESQAVKICEPLALACQLVVPPWPKSVVWYNKEGKVEPGERYHVLEDGVGGYLMEVGSAEWRDEGEWKCVATSSGGRVGMSTAYVSIEVPKNYRKPRFMENLQAVLTEEGLVSFECKVVGFPTPVLSWFKDGQELKPGDVYQLTGTNSLGSYCCIARNCMGSASSSAELTVEDIQNQLNEEEKLQLFAKNQAPKFVQGLKSVEAKIDEPFRFTIKVQIPPEPAVMWYRDDQPVDESARCKLAKEDRGVFYLDISNLEFIDQAEWKCVANNDFGHSVTSCFLKLIIPRHYKKPRFLENLQAILSDEGAVNLECKVIGVPQPVLKWYKDGEELKPGDIHRIISGQDGSCCLGTYTCEARNCMGIAASSASLLGFDDSMKAKKKKAEEQALQRNLSLSTIHEERTSQMYDTPVGDITLDDKGEISFSFDGKEVSVSLYETPDLTEEEALQIVEMYADQLSENVTEHNVVELPPLRFVKETSTSGNLLMEAIIIDVSPEYFVAPEEDLRTEADVEDISIADENGPPQLSLDADIEGEDYLEKTMAILSEERSDVPKVIPRKKSDSARSGDDFFSLSRDPSLVDEKRDDDTQVSESFASARSASAKAKSKSFRQSDEEFKDISESSAARPDLEPSIVKEVTQKHSGEPEQSPAVKPKRERRSSRGSRRSSSGSEKSLSRSKDEPRKSKEKEEPRRSKEMELSQKIQETDIQKKVDLVSDPNKSKHSNLTEEQFKCVITNVSSTLSKIINEVQIIERDIILKSELMSSAATASRSLEIISNLIKPLSEIHSIVDAIKESEAGSKEVTSSLFKNLPQPLKFLQQTLTIIEKCIEVESESKTLIKRTCVAFVEACGNNMQTLMSELSNVTSKNYVLIDDKTVSDIENLTKDASNVLKSSGDIIKNKNLLTEGSEEKMEESSEETKHLRETQKAVFELRSPLNSLLCIAESADSGKMVDVAKVKQSEVILTDMSGSIQDLQTALEQIESLSVKESTTSLYKYNTEIIETVMESVLKLRSSFEQLSTETKSDEDFAVLKQVISSIKLNLNDISSQIDTIERNVGAFDILQSENKLEVLQKMAQILIALENNLQRLHILPAVKNQMDIFHKNLTKVLENVIESNDAKKYFILLEVCDAVNRINSSIKNIDVDNVLSLASLGNTLTIIRDYFVKNVFESELNCAILTNIADVLVGIQEAINHAEENSMHVDSEHVEEMSAKLFDETKANIIIEHIDHTIAAISNIKLMETTKELTTAITPVLETIFPVLEDLKHCIASVKQNKLEQDEHVSEISEASLVQTLATPICELNQNIITLNQIIIENLESIKDSSTVVMTVAEPLHELYNTLEVLQQDVISQYGENVDSYEVSVNIASAVQNLQSCIVMIQEQAGVEIVDEMSTLEDISGIKTTADTIPSDRLVLPTAAEVAVEQALKPFGQDFADSATAQALQSLNEHITVLQTPEIIDALDSLSEISDFSSLKSITLGLGELHAGLEEILHPLVMETSEDVNLLNTNKLTTIAEPMQELQQSLSILDMSNIPVYEHILELPTDRIHSVLHTISEFKSQLDKCITAVFPAMETAEKTIEISNKVETLRGVCENLKDIIKTSYTVSHEAPVNQEVQILEETVNNLLDATDVSKGIKIENVKAITEKLYENILNVQEEIIQYTPQTPEKMSHEAQLVQAIDEIEGNIAVLEQYEFVDLSRASDMTSCTTPQLAMELDSESLLQMDDIVENAVNVVQDSTQDTPMADLMIIEDFFKSCKNEFTILRCLMTKQLSHKKIIRILQEFLLLQSTINDFRSKRSDLRLSEDIDSYLTTFLIHADDCLKNVQQSLIKIVQTQSNVLFKTPKENLQNTKKTLKDLTKGKISPHIAAIAKKFDEVIDATKEFVNNAETAVTEELKDVSNVCHTQQAKEMSEKLEDITVYLEEVNINTQDIATKEVVEKILNCIHKHEDYKEAVGTGKQLIIIKCLSECSDVLQESMTGIKPKITEQQVEECSLKGVLTEILEPLQALHSQLISVQEQVLSGVEEDSLSVDLPSTESLVQTMTEMQQEIQQVNIEKATINQEEISLILEVDKEIHSIQDSIRSMADMPLAQVVKDIAKPIEAIEQSLHGILSAEKISDSKIKLSAEESKKLVQHIDQYIELIEIVEEVSAVIKIEDLKETANVARELRESIAAIESVPEVKEDTEKEIDVSLQQSDLAHKLQTSLSALHVQVTDSAQELAPSLGTDVLLKMAQVTAQLQADLVAVSGIQVPIETPLEITVAVMEPSCKSTDEIIATQTVANKNLPLETAVESSEQLYTGESEGSLQTHVEVKSVSKKEAAAHITEELSAPVHDLTSDDKMENATIVTVSEMGKAISAEPTAPVVSLLQHIKEYLSVNIIEAAQKLCQSSDMETLIQTATVAQKLHDSLKITHEDVKGPISGDLTTVDQQEQAKRLENELQNALKVLQVAVIDTESELISEIDRITLQRALEVVSQLQEDINAVITTSQTSVHESSLSADKSALEPPKDRIKSFEEATNFETEVSTEDSLVTKDENSVALELQAQDAEFTNRIQTQKTAVETIESVAAETANIEPVIVKEKGISQEVDAAALEQAVFSGILMQHIEQFISEDITQVIDKLATPENINELKRSVVVAQELREKIAGCQIGAKSETAVEFTREVQAEKAQIAHQLQTALATLQLVALESTFDPAPAVSEDDLQNVLDAIAQLQDDLAIVAAIEQVIVNKVPTETKAVEKPEEQKGKGTMAVLQGEEMYVKEDSLGEKKEGDTITQRVEEVQSVKFDTEEPVKIEAVTGQPGLLQHIEEFISEQASITDEISALANTEQLQASVSLAKDLKETLAVIETLASSEDTASVAEEARVEQMKQVQKLQEALSTLQTEVLDSTQDITPYINSKALERISETVTHLQEDLAVAIVSHTSDEVKIKPEMDEENTMKHLEELLQEVSDKINTSASEKTVDDTETLRDTLDEVQTVIIKLKCDCNVAGNDTLNETLDDLECSVRSVQLQINEDSPPELLKEACATLQLLANNMSDTQEVHISGTKATEVKSEKVLEKCSQEASDTVKLLDAVSKLDTKDLSQLKDIVSCLTTLKNSLQSLKSSFSGDAETLIEKGVDVVESLNQIEDKVFSLEKDVENEKSLGLSTKENILTAVHSIYSSISNMRSTISTIQRQYMYESYGKPSERLLLSIKNINAILKSEEKDTTTINLKKVAKSIRSVLNHFEDVKFYVNLDKTARLPSDAAFTKVVLEELKSNISDVIVPIVRSSSPMAIGKCDETLKCLQSTLLNIETKSTLDVKEKIPIFKQLASYVLNLTNHIKSELENESHIKNEITSKENKDKLEEKEFAHGMSKADEYSVHEDKTEDIKSYEPVPSTSKAVLEEISINEQENDVKEKEIKKRGSKKKREEERRKQDEQARINLQREESLKAESSINIIEDDKQEKYNAEITQSGESVETQVETQEKQDQTKLKTLQEPQQKQEEKVIPKDKLKQDEKLDLQQTAESSENECQKQAKSDTLSENKQVVDDAKSAENKAKEEEIIKNKFESKKGKEIAQEKAETKETKPEEEIRKEEDKTEREKEKEETEKRTQEKQAKLKTDKEKVILEEENKKQEEEAKLKTDKEKVKLEEENKKLEEEAKIIKEKEEAVEVKPEEQEGKPESVTLEEKRTKQEEEPEPTTKKEKAVKVKKEKEERKQEEEIKLKEDGEKDKTEKEISKDENEKASKVKLEEQRTEQGMEARLQTENEKIELEQEGEAGLQKEAKPKKEEEENLKSGKDQQKKKEEFVIKTENIGLEEENKKQEEEPKLKTETENAEKARLHEKKKIEEEEANNNNLEAVRGKQEEDVKLKKEEVTEKAKKIDVEKEKREQEEQAKLKEKNEGVKLKEEKRQQEEETKLKKEKEAEIPQLEEQNKEKEDKAKLDEEKQVKAKIKEEVQLMKEKEEAEGATKEGEAKLIKEKEEAEKVKKEKEAQLEKEKKEAEKAKKEEEAKLKKEEEAKLKKEKDEAEQLKKAEEAKLKKEKEEAEKAKNEKEAKLKKEKDEAEKAKKEEETEVKKEKEEAEKAKKEKEAQLKKEKDEAEKAKKEEEIKLKKEKDVTEKARKEEEAKQKKEEEEEEKAKEEKELQLKKEKEEAEKVKKEEEAKLKKEKEEAEKVEKEKEAKLKKEKEDAEKAKREEETKPKKEKDDAEEAKQDEEAKLKKEKDEAEKMKKEEEAKQKEDKEEAAKVKKEDEAQLQKEKEEAEKAKREEEAKPKKEKEDAEKAKQDEEAKLKKEKDEAEKLKKEEEGKQKEEKEEAAKVNKEDEAQLQKDKEVAEKLKKEGEAKLKIDKEESDKAKKEKEAQLKKDKEEAEKAKKEEEAKLKKEKEEAEIAKKEEEAKLKKEKEEAEKAKKEEEAKLKKEKEEAEKVKKEKEAQLKKEKEEAEKAKKEEEAKLKKEKEEAEKAKKEEEAKLKKEKEEAEKSKKEEEAKLKKEKEEAEKVKKEKEATLKKEKDETEKLKKEEEAKLRKEKDETEKLKKEEEAKLRKEKEEAEKAKNEKEAKLKKEKDEAEKLKQEEEAKLKKEKEDAEKAKNEKEAKLKKEKEEAEKAKKEEEAKLKKEKEEAEKAKKEEEAKLKKEKEEAEKAKKEEEAKLEKEKEEVEKAKKEKEAKIKKEKEDAKEAKQEEEAKHNKDIVKTAEEMLKREKKEAEKAKSGEENKEQQEKRKLTIEKEKQNEEADKPGKEKIEVEIQTENDQTEKNKKETEKKRIAEEKRKQTEKPAKRSQDKKQKVKLNEEQDQKAEKDKFATEMITQEKARKGTDEYVTDKQFEGKIDVQHDTIEHKPKENGEREVALDRRKRSEHGIDTSTTLRKSNEIKSRQTDSTDQPRTRREEDYDSPTMRRKYEDREKPAFIEHNHKDYTMEFARPSGYRERTFDEKPPVFERDSRTPIIYKAHTLVLDSQLRSSLPPTTEDIPRSHSERRSEIRHKSKAVSEARSVLSEKRSSMPRDIKRKPVFSTYLTDRTAVEGSRVKLTCSVLSSSDPTVTWYKNGVLLDNKLKYRTKFANGLITLEVLNAVPSDSAEYSCTVENENGSVSSSANLKVYPSFEASPIPPTFTRSIRDTYHLAENELVLECRIRGQPLPTITWMKDDKQITSNERYEAFYLADGVCRLAISHPNPSDSGKYTCKAENSVWSDQISHVVNFTGKESRLSPNIATIERSRFNRQAMESRRPHFANVLNDYQVARGGTIGLQVEIRGDPTRVEWLREGRSVTEVYRNAKTFVEQDLYTLALSDVTEKESGLYTCRAWSSHGTVDMNAAITVVQPNELDGKPAIIAGRPEKEVHICVGEDVNISFRAQGEPKPKVLLMKGMRDISNSQRVCKMTSDDYVKFTLKRSVMTDAGTYCVLARNAYGCDRAFVTVVVRQRADSESFISDWNYPAEDPVSSIAERQYKSVPERIPAEPNVVDGGSNWVSIAWPKPDNRYAAPVLAYKVESWLLGKEGGARWQELGITPLNNYDAYNLKPGEQYHFRVTPRNRYGWGESVQTSQPVGVGLAGNQPEFVDILPGQLKVLIGETANLSCSVKGDPTPEVVWMKNGHEVEEGDGRVSSSFNGQQCRLSIAGVVPEDEARYSCEASNAHGRASTYARLAVVSDRLVWEADAKLKRERSAEVDGEYPPQFTMRLRDRRVQATYPVRLTCQVIGKPPPTVTWLKDAHPVTLDGRRTASQDEHFHTLEIERTTLEDGGVYEATARNNSGAVSCHCCLVVDKGIRAYVAPEFCLGLEPLYRVHEGEELRITAVVEAYPSVGVTWYRDGVRLRPSRRAVMTLDHDGQIELALAAVAPRDAGVYTCTASNEVGRVTTSGKVEVIGDATMEKKRTPPMFISPDVPYSKEPMFIRKPRSSEAREGDTVIIECEVIGDPKPDVYWLRDFLKPDYYRDATHFKRVGAGPEYRFEIPHAKLDYTGAYSVVAKNIHGEAKAIISLQIKVRDPDSTEEHSVSYGRVDVIPKFEREVTDLLCHDGDAIEFECRVTGRPEPYIRWFHYNELIRDCDWLDTSFEEGTARLRIKQVTAEDEGTYTCEAANNLGKATSSACLVVYPPGEPNTLSQQLRRPPALLSTVSTPRSTPRSTPARSVSRTPGPDPRRLCSPPRQMAPKFYTYPFNKVVEEGESVTFQCAVKGLPAPWATWDKDGVVLTPSARFHIREKDDVLRILEIDDVTPEDVGVYRITLENDHGLVDASARLEVISRSGKFHAGVRAPSPSPRRAQRRRGSLSRQD